MTDLTSAPIPPPGPQDHVRGEGELIVVYADLGCSHCASVWPELCARPVRLVWRHFPVASKHPRSQALHEAAEAASLQGAFFEMVDSIYSDLGHVDDPHLWERAERLGLDLGRFERDRRSESVKVRVRGDFESGIRAGVSATPATFAVADPG